MFFFFMCVSVLSSNLPFSESHIIVKLNSWQHCILKTVTWQVTSIQFPGSDSCLVLWSVFVVVVKFACISSGTYLPSLCLSDKCCLFSSVGFLSSPLGRFCQALGSSLPDEGRNSPCDKHLAHTDWADQEQPRPWKFPVGRFQIWPFTI